MAKTTPKATIDPERLYRVTFSVPFTHDGVKYIPRHRVRYTLRGSEVEKVKDHLDTYEAV